MGYFESIIFTDDENLSLNSPEVWHMDKFNISFFRNCAMAILMDINANYKIDRT